MRRRWYVLFVAVVVVVMWGYRAMHWPFIVPGSIAEAAQSKLEFNDGIGFYYMSEGKLQWLGRIAEMRRTGYLDDVREMASAIKKSTIEVSADDFRLYSFGLDFSQSGLPPHLRGYGLCYFYATPTKHSSLDYWIEDSGTWPARFWPMKGYDQPVYEIILYEDGLNRLRSGEAKHLAWGFQIALDDYSRKCYLFRFRSSPVLEGEAVASISHLKQLGLAMHIYASDYDGGLPKDPLELYAGDNAYLADKRLLVSPATRKAYTYFYLPEGVDSDPVWMVMFESMPLEAADGSRQRLALHADGHVSQMAEEAFQQLLAEQVEKMKELGLEGRIIEAK